MLTPALLEKIGFCSEDIGQICACDAPCSDALQVLADGFMDTLGQRRRVPYTPEEYTAIQQRVPPLLKQAEALCPRCHPYMAHLLFWLHCVERGRVYFTREGINEAVFWESMYDLVCKTRMCKKNYGRVGVYLDWFYLFFDCLLFSLGRLQFFIERFDRPVYRRGDYVLHEGDTVYSCHIPANGRLDIDDCLASFQQAYEFFKDDLPGPVIPITCHSWLLYPAYHEKVFDKASNIGRFGALFDIIDQSSTGKRFLDARNVFGRYLGETTDDLPRDTALQRSFIRFIEEGNEFGSGYGIILYDGVQKRILNHSL